MNRFFPINNEELDKTDNTRYLQDILYSWQDEMNLVTRFDIESGRIFHSFEKQNKADLLNGILRIWTKNDVIYIIQKLNAKQRKIPLNIFEKFDLIEKVFNRKGKPVAEMTESEKEAAFVNAIENAHNMLMHSDYNMAAYFAKSAQLYKNSPEPDIILAECRKKAGFQIAA